MSHTVDSVTTDYIWDVARGLPVVLQDGTNTYVYGLDLISATDGGGAQTYFLYDGLGSTTDLTDGGGNVIADYTYDVFGAIRSQTGGSVNYWLFTGEQRDSESDLYYLRARYYDPEIGRFLGQDPLPFPNLYAYAGSNPTNFIDPSGLCKWGMPCPTDIPIPPPPLPIPSPISTIPTVVGCAISSECRSDVADWATTVADHPTSVIQQTAGTAVAMFSSGDVSRENGVTFYENCWGACSFLRLTEDFYAINLGHYVFAEGPIFPEMKRHELRHVRHGDEYGLLWPLAYLWEMRHGYKCNRFEEEARAAAGQPLQCEAPKE